MNDIYVKFAHVYETMYRSLIDYANEADDYALLIDAKDGDNIFEVACGTGNMFPYFNQKGCKYTGIDFNASMLDVARHKHPEAQWMEGDMRDLKTTNAADGIFLMSRSLSYMISNQDLIQTCQSLHQALKPGKKVAFDVIDANKFMMEIAGGTTREHSVQDGKLTYERTSLWSIDASQSWTFRWVSEYYITEDNSKKHIYTDDSVVRAFTKDDILLAMHLAGFNNIEIQSRQAYTFPTLMAVATK